MESIDWADERRTRWRRRSAELDTRIRDLHERNAQLSVGFVPSGSQGRSAVGSTPDQVARARAAARMARLRALEALRRTGTMLLRAARAHDRAARAHDRAARLHELLADANSGDVGEHLDRAALHRGAAHADRAAADAIFRSQHAALPESGPC